MWTVFNSSHITTLTEPYWGIPFQSNLNLTPLCPGHQCPTITWKTCFLLFNILWKLILYWGYELQHVHAITTDAECKEYDKCLLFAPFCAVSNTKICHWLLRFPFLKADRHLLRNSERWRFRSPRMWYDINMQISVDVSKDHNAFTFTRTLTHCGLLFFPQYLSHIINSK
jgi:hypothetical protein